MINSSVYKLEHFKEAHLLGQQTMKQKMTTEDLLNKSIGLRYEPIRIFFAEFLGMMVLIVSEMVFCIWNHKRHIFLSISSFRSPDKQVTLQLQNSIYILFMQPPPPELGEEVAWIGVLVIWLVSYLHSFFSWSILSSIFSSNSKALSSELLENLEKMVHRYYMSTDMFRMFTHYSLLLAVKRVTIGRLPVCTRGGVAFCMRASSVL